MKTQFNQSQGSTSRETNKEAIARIFGLKKSQVGYLSTSTPIDSYVILFDKETQTYWYRGPAIGTPISWSVTANMELFITTSSGSYYLSYANYAYQLASNKKGMGASLIGLQQGGSVQNAIVTVHVDAFGADPTGKEDSTQAVINAQNSVNDITNSLFVGSERSYARIVFGNGRYIIGDVPIKSGFSYVGQGSFATTILPKAGASWCFKSVGTEPHETSGSSKRLFRAEFEGLHIGCGLVNVFSDYPIPTGVGGIYIAHASYIKMDDVYIRHMDGPGFWAESLWDSEIYNLRIMYVGNARNKTSTTTIGWGLYIGAGNAPTDGSNANRFYGLHIEGCPAQLCVDKRSRHNFFLGGKLEWVRYNDISQCSASIISGVDGLVFSDMELSSSQIITPMFDIVGTTTVIDTSADDVSDPECDHSRGVVFINPSIIDSNALSGWYFRHKSDRGPLQIIGGYGRHIRTLFSGSDLKLDGLTTVQSGGSPNGIIIGTSNCDIRNLTMMRHRSTPGLGVLGMTLTGTGHRLRDCNFSTPYGSVSDGNTWILTNSSSEVVVDGLVLGGATQYGISGTASTQWSRLRNISTASGATYGEVVRGGVRYVGLPMQLYSDSGRAAAYEVVVAPDATVTTPSIIGGGTRVNIRCTRLDGVAVGAGEVFYDVGLAGAIKSVDMAGNLETTSAGASGDSQIHFVRVADTLAITNRTTVDLRINLLAITAR